jgi:EAL domain-containing protein (putative c-di-GMP-specific phosphodiesterase class I)
VLAEGIEDDAQCARLAALGVDAGQGWLFGHPVPDPAPDRIR